MAGSTPGPMAKPDEMRARSNEPTVEQTVVETDKLPEFVDRNPTPPPANDKWHPDVKDFWEGMRTDPARMWMTSGDWLALKIVCESMSRGLKPQVVATIPGYKDPESGEYLPGDVVKDVIPINGSQMMAFLKFLSMVGVTEGARRAYGMHIKLGVGTDDLKQSTGKKVAKGNRTALFAVPDSGQDND